MARVTTREAARRDLVEHFVYLADNAGLETAERFLRCAETSFNELAAHPLIGAQVILIRIRNCFNNPIPVADRFHPFIVVFKRMQGLDELVFKCV